MAKQAARARLMSNSLVSQEPLIIDHIGPEGDGVVRTAAGPLFVPRALPGETVRQSEIGWQVQESSPDRANPFCPVFTSCGGCTTQHMSASLYAKWKQEAVARALDKAGLHTEVAPTVLAHGKGRRRAIIHVRFKPEGIVAGYMEAKSHRLLALDHCPVLVPELAPAFSVARAVCAPLKARNKPLDVQITATDSGLDVDIRGHGVPEESERLALTKIAQQLDLARLSVHRVIIVERRAPMLEIAGAPLHLPPRSFLQATGEAETILADLALKAIGKAKSVGDLFCGVGPFALKLATRARVVAADGDAEAIIALTRAARLRTGLKPLVAEARDLFRRPMLPMELNALDAVVLDPPRAGAEAQMRQIAASKLKTVVSISCDTASFIRDGLILQAGGFKLEHVTPVDQFAWTRHIELVGLFRR
jgi:23S rRNA (uracil1939-C5)-methyltransferase